MDARAAYVPYCGLPPLPDDWIVRWNADPVLIGVLVVMAAAYEACRIRAQRLNPGGRTPHAVRSFRIGWTIVALALVSPLCALSVALFSARVTQHVLLLFVGVPLLVLGRPWSLYRSGRRHVAGPARTRLGGAGAAVALSVLFWAWHSPALYAATFESTPAYWAMHLSLLAAAAAFWSAVLRRDAHAPGPLVGTLALAAVLVQMGFLGALITLAPGLLYTPHVLTTTPFGLSPLEDQQLGGLVMWVPGGLSFGVVALLLLGSLLRGNTAQAR